MHTFTRLYNHTHIQTYLLINVKKYNHACIEMAAAVASSLMVPAAKAILEHNIKAECDEYIYVI